MHPYTKFWNPTLNNIGDEICPDMLRTLRTDRLQDGQCDYYMPPKDPSEA